MKDSGAPDRRPFLNGERRTSIGARRRALLNVALRINGDRRVIGADDRTKPDADACTGICFANHVGQGHWLTATVFGGSSRPFHDPAAH